MQHRFRLEAKVGLWFSVSCCLDKRYNGLELNSFIGGGINHPEVFENTVLDERLGTVEILNRIHVPFRKTSPGKFFPDVLPGSTAIPRRPINC